MCRRDVPSLVLPPASTAVSAQALDVRDATGSSTSPLGLESRRDSRLLEVAPPLVVLAAAAIAAQPLSDPDVWWHLRTGQLILRQGLVSADPWSFVSANHWQLHEWLSEVSMYGACTVASHATGADGLGLGAAAEPGGPRPASSVTASWPGSP